MLVGLFHLKDGYNRSDDQILARWLESPYMQYFIADVDFQHELPCDPLSLTRWRNLLDEAGAEEVLAQTIEAAKTLKAIRPRELRVVSINTTVQEKNVPHPAGSRLLEVARAKLAERAAEAGIKLRQSYARTGPRLNRQAGRYAHARQYKRMRRMSKRQRTIVGRLLRDIDRKATPDQVAQLAETMHSARPLKEHKTKGKNKLYASHNPEVKCISRGKARRPFEFGMKASFAFTTQGPHRWRPMLPR